MKRVLPLAILFACAFFAHDLSAQTAPESKDQNLFDGLARTPDWLTVSASNRTRFEFLSEPNVVGEVGNRARYASTFPGDVAYPRIARGSLNAIGFVSVQTGLQVEATAGPLSFGVELLDARSYALSNQHNEGFIAGGRLLDICEDGACATTNAFEPIQAYATLQIGEIGAVTLGRFTMALGSERLITRSPFRNTIQSYYGAKAEFSLFGNDKLNLFYTLPYASHDPETDNIIKLDLPDEEQHFWGGHYEHSGLISDVAAEIYTYGRWGRQFGDSNRFPYPVSSVLDGIQLTSGLRLARAPRPAGFDLDLEFAGQFANNKFTSLNDQDFGFFAHGEIGRTFDNGWRTRFAALFDIASGAHFDKSDRVEFRDSFIFVPCNNPPENLCGQLVSRPVVISDANLQSADPAAFDSLFGDFSRDFGPEGLFGVLRRSNIISPAVRFEAAPTDNFAMSATYRAARPFQDPTYYNVRFGTRSIDMDWAHQIDARATYSLFDDSITLEAGAAYIALDYEVGYDLAFRNPIARQGYESFWTEPEDAVYGYTSVTFRF